MKYTKYNNRIYLVKAPRPSISLKWAKDKEIIDTLNRLLEISFLKEKSEDFNIHFFDKKASKQTSYKKKYIVFQNKCEFFNYFKITGNDKKILNEIFPEEYLTFFDNSSLDISI